MSKLPAQSATLAGTDPTAPSVHPEETTRHEQEAASYRDRLLRPVLPEYYHTAALYHRIDDREGSDRFFSLSCCRDLAYFAVNKRDRSITILSSACRLRWCPLCSSSRSSIISSNVLDWLSHKRQPKVLTLTLAHGAESLDSQITRLYAAFRELRRRKTFARLCRGGIWFFQIKWSEKTSQWHPHLHCLLHSTFIPHSWLKAAWFAITGDSSIVDIRAIHNPKVAADYVSRYAARPAKLCDIPTEHHVELYDAMHGRRICGTWGTAKSCKLTAQSKFTIDDYVRITDWDSAFSRDDPTGFYAAVRDCYFSRKPLPDCFDIESYRDRHPLDRSADELAFDSHAPPSLFA